MDSYLKPFEKFKGCGRGSGDGGSKPAGPRFPNAGEENIGLGIKGGKPLEDIGNGDVKGI